MARIRRIRVQWFEEIPWWPKGTKNWSKRNIEEQRLLALTGTRPGRVGAQVTLMDGT